MSPVTAFVHVFVLEGSRPGVVRKTALNPSANRAGWSPATPGIAPPPRATAKKNLHNQAKKPAPKSKIRDSFLTANSRPEASNFAWPLPSPSRRATLTAARRRGTPDSAVRVQIATITSPPHNRQPMHRLPDQRCSSVGVYIDGL